MAYDRDSDGRDGIIRNPVISVVMAAYNGSKYIVRQMESIRSQSIKPDEVLICDDCSTDKTFDIAAHFINKHDLKTWRVYRNSANAGWKKNFFEASKMVSGDIIFFSDQDDVWHPTKIERMARLFIKYGMDALYSEKNVIDGYGNLNEARMEKIHFTNKVSKIKFSESFYAVKTLGCCECISKKILDKYHEINMPECGHDSQCGRIALLYGTLWHLDAPLIDYRIHSSNSSGISGEASFGHSTNHIRTADLVNTGRWIQRVLMDEGMPAKKRCKVVASLMAIRKRTEYLKADSKVPWIALLKYYKAFPDLTAVLGDFAYRHNINRRLGNMRWRVKKIVGR